jgi:hypothetical protein
LNLDEDDDIILGKAKLDLLSIFVIILVQNDKIMTKLRNSKLKRIIKSIDSTKYKKKTLEKIMNDKDFREFADDILKTLGYLKDNSFTY